MKKNGFIYMGIMLLLIIASFAWIRREKEIAKAEIYHDKPMGTIHLTKAEFLKKVSNFETNPTSWKYLGDKPCIIDFYATWCGPCKMIAPILEDLAKEYNGQIYIYKVNIDAERDIANANGVHKIPTLFFCTMNGNPQVVLGDMPKESFQKAINEVLLKK